LEKANEDTTILVMSDHGAGPLHRWVQLNRWLAQEGFLTFLKEGKTPGLKRSSVAAKLARAYKRNVSPVMRERIRTWLSARFDLVRAALESQMFASGVDWSKTSAYSLGACGNIYLNLVGREPIGVVPLQEYEKVRNEIIAQLYTLKDPETDSLLVRVAHKREDLYHGPFVERAPDIVIEWADYRYWGRGRFEISAPSVLETRHHHDFSELPVTGTHRPEGIFILNGPDVQQGMKIEGARIIDMAPTIMYLLAQPIPQEMDGRLLQEALLDPPTEIGYTETETEGETSLYTYSQEDQQYIEGRLKDLGYL
jgi:predicted AlkP superfamily phosphohydrolase/phosphomutase